MRNLSPARRRTAALAGGLAAVAGSSSQLLKHPAGTHAAFAFGLLFGAGLGVTLLIGLKGRFGGGSLGCERGTDSPQ